MGMGCSFYSFCARRWVYQPWCRRQFMRFAICGNGGELFRAAGVSCCGRFEGWRVTAKDYRRIALSLPGASEGSHQGHPDFRVGGKIYCTLGYEKEGFGVLKLSLEEQAGLVDDAPEVFSPVPGGWGRMGMTRVKLDAVSADVLEGALKMAWKRRLAK
jgi:hypothetical protein